MPKRIYRAAIYCRLSREDGDKLESNSIASQRAICEDFIARHEDIELAIEPFVDDGYSGVSFERPEFNRMMNDIRTGRIRCLVVRDLSRFGRDYIEMGTYLERVFPQIGLRFISVKDRFDSFDTADGNESLVIPLQNMINTLYSKDISRKVSTAVRAQMEQGTFRNLPYGYRWDTARTSMVIDEEAAKYVRMMFQWKIGGLSMSAMLDRLEEMGASNPELRKRQVGTRTGEGCSCEGWHKSTVYGILTNPNYVGDTVLRRSERAIYKGVRSHNIKDKDAWIIFPGTHEAIISREDFQRVQAMMDAASDKRQRSFAQTSAQRTALTDFFEGKIICADCGRRMYFHRKRVDKSKPERWYAFYECSTAASRRHGGCTWHYLRQDRLGQDVLAAIQIQVQAALDYDRLLDKLRGSSGEAKIRDQQNALITSLDLKLGGLARKRTRLYDDYVEDVLDEDEYTFAKRSYDEQYAELSRCRDEAIQRRTRFQEAMSADNKWIMLMKSISTAETLSQELVDEAVELVKVYEDGAIELVLNYGDIYALTLESIRDVQEAM